MYSLIADIMYLLVIDVMLAHFVELFILHHQVAPNGWILEQTNKIYFIWIILATILVFM